MLVVYVADPPISDGIQGAYFVAALLSGCIIGGLSLIFTEVTQGLGCLLGGFCLAMWFLILKSGGLIQNTAGRIGFIAALCVFAFAFAFSSYTRTYGLLVCIAFAGAFIVVIGIDCFSRAGLKEFLVYIWGKTKLDPAQPHVYLMTNSSSDLNSELFPLDTNTYPLTRGIKVEIAVIIIMFLCGVLSQLKLYKIFKERLDKKTARRAQDAEDREHLEADLGKRIEDTNLRERELWERKYHEFDKGHVSAAASAVGSIYAPSTASRAQSVKDMTMSVREETSPDADGMEMKTLQPQGSRDEGSKVTVHVRSTRDEPTDRPAHQMAHAGSSRGLERIVEDASRASSPQPSPNQTQPFKHMSLRPSAPPPPAIIPMPFTVSEQELEHEDDTQSQATAAETAAPRKSARLQRRRSHAGSAPADDYASDFESDDDVDISHIEDDRASSLAATADNLTEDGDDDLPAAVSRSASLIRPRLVKARSLRQPSLRRVGSAADLGAPPSLPDSAVSGLRSTRRMSDPAPTALVELVLDGPEDKAAQPLADILALKTGQIPDVSIRAPTKHTSTSSRAASRLSSSGTVSLAEVKNEKPLSKLALKYRTHEWTKFLGDAEEPELGDIQPTEGGIQVERQTSTQERVAPLDVEALSRSGSQVALRYGPTNSTNPYRNMQRQSSASAEAEVPGAHYTMTIQPLRPVSGPSDAHGNRRQTLMGGSNPHLKQSTSQPTVQTQGLRHTFMPLSTQPLTKSPIEHDLDASIPGRSSPIPGSTLLGIREDMMRRKTTMVTNNSFNRSNSSLLRNTSGANLAYAPTALEANPRSYSSFGPYHVDASPNSAKLYQVDTDKISLSSRKAMLNQDDMPLSRRKTLIQQSRRISADSQQSLWADVSQAQMQQQQQQQFFPQHAPQATVPQANHSHIIYDAHLPQRGPSVDQYTRQARLASFRESLRKDIGPSAQAVHAAAADEGHRFAMLNEKRQAQAMREQQKFERNTLDSAVDHRMRNGDMIGLHRDMLRRMQQRASEQAQ